MSAYTADYPTLTSGPGTGALGGPPTGHNYKRAVYRPPPKEFGVEALPPTKFGSGFCYGMRISPIQPEQSDSRSIKSGGSYHEYDVWRRWEDCLWFQEIIESEYALMARQKRTRLAAGKGVKKNGVYIQSDQAASFESLPPGPDANSIAKHIHELLPRLTKKGTLFRASQATVDQRGREFEALIRALFQEDVPMLVRELRETRLVRDFFGYWRRDLDHDRKKRQSVSGKGTSSARNSVSSSAFSMYFSASNISLQVPSPYVDLPPSPALPTSRSLQSQQDSSRRSSIQRDEPRRRSTGPAPTASYATSESSASTVSVGDAPHSPTSPQEDLTFYVSVRGSLALNVGDDDARAEYVNAPLSAPARVQHHAFMRESDHPFPSASQVDEMIFVPEPVKSGSGAVTGDFYPGLQALPEDSELVSLPHPTRVHAQSNTASDIEEVPRVPLRRPRNNSCPDRTNRQCLFIPADAPRGPPSANSFSIPHLDTNASRLPPYIRTDRPPSRDGEQEPLPLPTPTYTSSSRTSSAAFSGFSSLHGDDASWRTSMASETSYAQSFATSFANGSCADFDKQSRRSFATTFANGSCADFDADPRASRHSLASVYSVSSSGRQTALARRESVSTFMSDLTIDSELLPRDFTPSPHPSGSLRRSLSAGSRRPPSRMAVLGGQEDWYEQQEDFIDAYFYDPGILSMPPTHFDEPPRTPPLPPQREPSKEISTPDRFPKPFQNRPPGQFHLPWSPPSTPGPERELERERERERGPLSAPPAPPFAFPHSPPASPASALFPGESITLKAVLQESIVLLRIPRAAPLHDVHARLRDKFAAQEGVQLARAFVIGWAPSPTPSHGIGSGAAQGRSRPRSNSASSVGAMHPQALRYVYAEEEWRAAVAACVGGKMTIRLFNARPI